MGNLLDKIQGFFRWGVKSQTQGYNPSVRIWVQRLTYNEAQGDFDTPVDGKVVELKDWTSINLTRSRSSEGSLTINIPNPRDKFLRYPVKRSNFKYSDNQGGNAVLWYYKDLFSRFGDYVAPLNPEQITSDPAEAQEAYLKLGWLFGVGPANTGRKSLSFFRAPNSDTGLATMQRIFVDILGEDGLVYAGFSGLISSIAENFDVSSEPSISLTCKDNLRMFSIAELSTQRPLWDIYIPSDQRPVNSLNSSPVYTQTFSQFKSVSAVVGAASKIVQESFCFPSAVSAAVQFNGLTTDPSKKVKLPGQESFWFKENFWTYEGNAIKVDPDDGYSPLRLVAGQPRGIAEGDTLKDLEARILIDRYLSEAAETQVYQLAIAQTFELFQPQRIQMAAVCRRAAELMWSDWFCNGNGDIVFQMMKFNNLPCSIETEDRKVGDKTLGRTPVITSMAENRKPIPGESSAQPVPDGWDFSPSPDYTPQKNHGYNYVIADPSYKGHSLVESEDPIYNFVKVPIGGQMEVKNDAVMDLISLTGIAEDPVSIKRFGARALESSKIFSQDLFKLDDKLRKTVLNLMAFLLMRKMQAAAKTGALRLVNRPDIDVAKTVFLFMRQKVGLVDSITVSYSKGQPIGTSLTLSHVRDFSEATPNPWVVVRNLL